MEQFWHPERDPDYFFPRYNCTFYNATLLSPSLAERQRVGFGYIMEGVGYLNLIFLFWNLTGIYGFMSQSSAWRLLYVLGWLDIVGTVNSFLVIGWFAMSGTVYCTDQASVYFNGALAVGLWITAGCLKIVMAVERCAHKLWPWLYQMVFGADERIWFHTVAPVMLGIWAMFFGAPLIWSARLGGWAENPHFGYFDEMQPMYTPDFEYLHKFNLFFVVSLPPMYIVTFSVIIVKKVARRCFEKTITVPSETNWARLDGQKHDEAFAAVFSVVFMQWVASLFSIGFFGNETLQSATKGKAMLVLIAQCYGLNSMLIWYVSRTCTNGFKKAVLCTCLCFGVEQLSASARKEFIMEADMLEDDEYYAIVAEMKAKETEAKKRKAQEERQRAAERGEPWPPPKKRRELNRRTDSNDSD